MKTEMTTPAGQPLILHRYPRRKNETLQAFDAADEYLIEHVAELSLPAGARVLIINDHFGALSCWASQQGYDTIQVSDSVVAQQATVQNLAANALPSVVQLTSLEPLPERVDVVLLRIPKSTRMLSWQLQQLAAITDSSIPVIAAAKTKEIHTSTLNQFEHQLGNTVTSLAKKKARLVFCTPRDDKPELIDQLHTFDVPDYAMTLANFPNVFSAQKLDIAAYLMLPHIPSEPGLKRIVDLGCGNGVLALQAARNNPNAFIHAVDESHMAVASAQRNLLAHHIAPTRFQCEARDCLSEFAHHDVDLVMCNPPFHQQQAITDHIAWQMFCDAKRVLTNHGRLLVIGNRHLGYHAKLKRLFGNVSVIASNKKFVILQAVHAQH
ncbi:50S rRNA methyltransferase [Salinivibrio sp. PR919]|nr:50S rRNA methyltransferase [Salinivibrio sp. PR919]OOF18293.1 50S rRNA methyltransferase [Salinivibrio sp. PR932]OOF32542.1 50S rRNA methyltransferase [Salinivibrio proteolyticus]